jgi:polyisoprenoid-binding protein YceI
MHIEKLILIAYQVAAGAAGHFRGADIMSTTAVQTLKGRTVWAIDPTHTNVEFAVRHLMITTVKGRFAEVSGTVVLDDANPAAATAEITIGAASIDTREPQRDAHLRSGDFFQAETYPSLTFRSTSVRAIAPEGFTLVGDLTIKGVTREVELAVTSEGRTKDPWGGERAGYSAVTRIKRSDFGLTWNQLLETGGVAVSDEVKISLDIELVNKGPAGN